MTTKPDPEKLKEAIDLVIAIHEDLITETTWPEVSTGMSYRAALDNAQQLLDTLQAAAGEGS